ncbi:MAG: phytanoyl-CoA dioxygenase family protein [Phycisphaeraceae bacterium]
MSYLSPAQVEQFLEDGYIKLNGVFPRDVAERWVARGWERLGYDPTDVSTWAAPRTHLPCEQRAEVRAFAPEAWAAICDLLGGEARINEPYKWSDGFITNLGIGADKPWRPASSDVGGWHKDGDFFRHFLDSPEQGLLTIVLWTDVEHQAGPTYIAPDSVGVVARHLAEHPQGVAPDGFPTKQLISQCSRFVEATGKAGDVYLMHPYMLHASSQNVRRLPRFITNPPVSLREPMNFNRDDAGDFSLLERGVLRGLGVDRFDFKPTAERQRIVPERVRKQQALREAEKARQQAGAGS